MCHETGVLTAQALTVAEPLGLRATVHLNYADQPVNHLLGLDTLRESVTALLAFRHAAQHAEDRAREPTLPFSSSYSDLLARPTATTADPPPTITHLLPVAAALHAASLTPGPPPQHTKGTDHDGTHTGHSLPLPGLAAAGRHHPDDLRDMVHLHCLVSNVENLPPGTYRYDPGDHVLLPIAGPDAVEAVVSAMRAPMTRLALREAAVALIPVGDPEAETARYADRGYRLLQIATGLAAHRAALAAAALGLGARLHLRRHHRRHRHRAQPDRHRLGRPDHAAPRRPP